jgi:hypothetical protein
MNLHSLNYGIKKLSNNNKIKTNKISNEGYNKRKQTNEESILFKEENYTREV